MQINYIETNMIPFFLGFAESIKWPDIGAITPGATPMGSPFADPLILLGAGIVLIIATILVLLFMKKIIVNTILGLILWSVVNFIFNANLPWLPSLVVAAIFGPAGVGVMLLLRFFGIL
ncbi:MAG: hypothetical protein NTZ73_03915 [Candidatus Diapherotrites archaeon]|nr:hypothetical protein [Candidatus Diapherotrites archaeon]